MVEDRGVDGLRGKGRDVDVPIARQLASKAFGEGPDGILADYVRGDLWGADPAPDGGHVDQHARALLLESSQGSTSAMDLAHQVRLDHLTKDLGGNVEELAVGDHAGVVDPDVDPPEAPDRKRRESLDGILFAD